MHSENIFQKESECKMNIYLLRRNYRTFHKYEENTACVVIAGSPKEARRVAAKNAGAEIPKLWVNPHYSSCKKIGVADTDKACFVLAENRGA